jgi:flagellar biogenesis protein FliO
MLLAMLAAPVRGEDQNPLRGAGDWPSLRPEEKRQANKQPEAASDAAESPDLPWERGVDPQSFVAASYRRSADEQEDGPSSPVDSKSAAPAATVSSDTSTPPGNDKASTSTEKAPADAAPAADSAAKPGGDLNYQPLDYPEPVDFGDTLGRLLSATLGVLAICGVGLWAARKWLRRLPAGAVLGEQANVLGSVNLGSRCLVQLVELNGCRFVVGRDAGGIKAVMSVPEPFADSVDRLERTTALSP